MSSPTEVTLIINHHWATTVKINKRSLLGLNQYLGQLNTRITRDLYRALELLLKSTWTVLIKGFLLSLSCLYSIIILSWHLRSLQRVISKMRPMLGLTKEPQSSPATFSGSLYLGSTVAHLSVSIFKPLKETTRSLSIWERSSQTISSTPESIYCPLRSLSLAKIAIQASMWLLTNAYQRLHTVVKLPQILLNT